MADITNPEMIGIDRQRQLSQALLKRGLETPESQMISGRFVGASPVQYLANLFNQYAGQKGLEAADVQQQALADKLRQQGVSEVGDILTLAQGRPELPSQELAGPGNPYDAFKKPTIDYPAVAGDTQAALAKALTAQSPQAQALAPTLMQNLLPKKTDKLIEYETYKAETPEGKRLPFTDWVDRNDKARLALDEKRYGLEAARFNLEKSKSEVNSAEAPLRASFLGQIQPHVLTSQAYRKIVAAPETAAGDLSLIYGYMKILDPGSAVKEGEYATAENARGVPETIKSQYNKAINGQRLAPRQRTEFIQSAGDLVNSQKSQFDTQKKFYTDISMQSKINPANVIYDPYADLEIKTTPPKLPKTAVNAGQQLNIPQAGGGNGWNIVNVTPSK